MNTGFRTADAVHRDHEGRVSAEAHVNNDSIAAFLEFKALLCLWGGNELVCLFPRASCSVAGG